MSIYMLQKIQQTVSLIIQIIFYLIHLKLYIINVSKYMTICKKLNEKNFDKQKYFISLEKVLI